MKPLISHLLCSLGNPLSVPRSHSRQIVCSALDHTGCGQQLTTQDVVNPLVAMKGVVSNSQHLSLTFFVKTPLMCPV